MEAKLSGETHKKTLSDFLFLDWPNKFGVLTIWNITAVIWVLFNGFRHFTTQTTTTPSPSELAAGFQIRGNIQH